MNSDGIGNPCFQSMNSRVLWADIHRDQKLKGRHGSKMTRYTDHSNKMQRRNICRHGGCKKRMEGVKGSLTWRYSGIFLTLVVEGGWCEVIWSKWAPSFYQDTHSVKTVDELQSEFKFVKKDGRRKVQDLLCVLTAVQLQFSAMIGNGIATRRI